MQEAGRPIPASRKQEGPSRKVLLVASRTAHKGWTRPENPFLGTRDSDVESRADPSRKAHNGWTRVWKACKSPSDGLKLVEA